MPVQTSLTLQNYYIPARIGILKNATNYKSATEVHFALYLFNDIEKKDSNFVYFKFIYGYLRKWKQNLQTTTCN